MIYMRTSELQRLVGSILQQAALVNWSTTTLASLPLQPSIEGDQHANTKSAALLRLYLAALQLSTAAATWPNELFLALPKLPKQQRQ